MCNLLNLQKIILAGEGAELDVTPGTTVAMDQVLAVIAPTEEAR